MLQQSSRQPEYVASKDAAAGSKVAGKRVLIVLNCDAGGGVEHLAAVLRRFLEGLGAEVICHRLYKEFGASAFAKLTGIARGAARIASYAPDVLIAFQPTSSVVAGIVGRLRGCRARLIHQSNLPLDTQPVARLLDKWAGSLGFYTVNIMNSAATERAFANYPASYRRRCRRVVHGIAWHGPKRDREAVRRAHAIPQDVPVLLTCARLCPQKSLDTVISVLPRLKAVHFVLAGQGADQQRLEAIAGRLGVSDRVHFLGLVPHEDLFDLHAAADLFVFPSRWETFGLAAVEAAMQGLPIIASGIPAVREVLTIEGLTPAVFVDDWDPANWAFAIGDALKDQSIRARAQAFAPRLRELYSEDRMLRGFMDLLEEALR